MMEKNFIIEVQNSHRAKPFRYVAAGQRQYSYKLVRLARNQDVFRQDENGHYQIATFKFSY